jgi:hypothetical protein
MRGTVRKSAVAREDAAAALDGSLERSYDAGIQMGAAKGARLAFRSPSSAWVERCVVERIRHGSRVAFHAVRARIGLNGVN